MTEPEAVQLAKQNDPVGFDFLYREHRQFIENLCATVVGATDAPDLAQETFLVVQTRIQQFRGDSSFRTWLFRLALNRCRMELRRRRVRPETDLRWAEKRTETFQPELSLTVNKILGDLPDQQRNLFCRYVLGGFTSPELAQQEHIPLATIKSQLFRIRTKLRVALESIR